MSRLPRDFAIAALLALACNLLVCPSAREDYGDSPRILSYRLTAGEVRRLAPEPPIDLAIFGDSRSLPLAADALCRAMSPPRERCVNASSTSGDWITVYELYQGLERLLADDAILVVAVSDYWLEMGGRHSIGLLPRSTAYAELGDFAATIESYLPLSVTRGARLQQVREQIESAAANVRAAVAPRNGEHPAPPSARSGEHSNVDRWYRPTRDRDRAEHSELGARVLERLGRSHRVALLYLPNPAERERYVDAVYPGRRARFFEELAALAARSNVGLVDLSGRLNARRHYRDLHHLKKSAIPRVTGWIARELSEARAGPRTPQEAAEEPTDSG